MLSCCESFVIAEQVAQAQPIMEAIPILVEKSKVSGICEEEDLDNHIGSIDNGFFKSPIDNMANRGIIQQRALWLNKQGVLDRRKADNDRKANAAAIAQQKKDTAARNKESRQKLEQAQLEPLDVALSGPPPIGTWCEGECKKSKTTEDVPGNDWLGCNGLEECGKWYCSSKNCTNKLNKHRILCCARKIVST